MSGLPSELIALGGFNERDLKICEKYLVFSNKWKALPPLNTARQMPGSILLSSQKAFCFCGILEDSKKLNSIESLNTETDEKWKTFPPNNKIDLTFHLAAVEY